MNSEESFMNPETFTMIDIFFSEEKNPCSLYTFLLWLFSPQVLLALVEICRHNKDSDNIKKNEDASLSLELRKDLSCGRDIV